MIKHREDNAFATIRYKSLQKRIDQYLKQIALNENMDAVENFTNHKIKDFVRNGH